MWSRSIYIYKLAASFWHPSSPRMFSLEVSLITMSTFQTRKQMIRTENSELLSRCVILNKGFHTHTYIYIFSSTLLQGTIATTRQEPMLPSCSVKLRLKVMFSFLKVTATSIIVTMFMWRKNKEKKRKPQRKKAWFSLCIIYKVF